MISKKEKIGITNIRKWTADITTHSTNIKRIVRKYYEYVHADTFNNLNEIENFLKLQKLEAH